jgi:uncharacterized protein
MKSIPIIFITALSLLFAACSIITPRADPSVFYRFSQELPEDVKPTISDTDLVIMPVLFPSYLDRPQIVQQSHSHEIIFSEYARWAEPFDDGATRIIRENLADLLGTQNIRQFPYHGGRTNDKKFYLRTTISTFEADTVDNVNLKATWRITDYLDAKVYASGSSKINLKTNVANYDAIVSTMSKCLGLMCLEITEAINKIDSH